jgi:hypothetical protein
MTMSRDEQLAALRAERAALLAAREEREARASADDEIEAERVAIESEKAIAAAVQEHGPLDKKIACVDTDLGIVLVKRPHHVLYRKFQDSGEATTAEFDKLVRPCVVHPSRARWDAMLEDQPGILPRVAAAVCTLAGARLKDVGGKS